MGQSYVNLSQVAQTTQIYLNTFKKKKKLENYTLNFLK